MITEAELDILQHSIGADKYGRGRVDRNHFCTGAGGTDHPVCMSLVAKGFMWRQADVKMYGGADLFRVTLEGIAAVIKHSPTPPPEPKLTRSQKRYRDFLNYDSGLTFWEYLQAFHGRRRRA